MGLTSPEIVALIADEGLDTLLQRLPTDNAFVKQHGLESLRESLALDYPSYILALAMGAGKTILMGSIVATEFALALEYPDGPFVENALIFAPGKTILGALRELADIPYERLLPPRFHKPFAASLKLTFTRDGDKQIPITWGSSFNVIVTNTEKIRIQKPTTKNGAQHRLFGGIKDEEAAELANLRLQAIASLPHLAVFSDEAHHTYGQKLLGKWETDAATGEPVFKDDGIKKVRRTIDYLARETNLIVVVNATGTPYFQRQPLRDVVAWYGLGEGIRDGVLKELAGNIKVFELGDAEAAQLVGEVIDDFAADYWPVALPNGAPARLALYFPNIETRDELRPAIDSALARHGIGADTVLVVDNKSSEATRRAFEAVARDPAAPHRILLLVNMGTEGWNCPSLFACALVRKLAHSNNFVLQAATRCLRQVPGNTHPARVYLTSTNRRTLEDQLAETYGTSLHELDSQHAARVEKEIRLHKPHLPPLLIRRRVLRFRRKANGSTGAVSPAPTLIVPDVPAPSRVGRRHLHHRRNRKRRHAPAAPGCRRRNLAAPNAPMSGVFTPPPPNSVPNTICPPPTCFRRLRTAYGDRGHSRPSPALPRPADREPRQPSTRSITRKSTSPSPWSRPDGFDHSRSKTACRSSPRASASPRSAPTSTRPQATPPTPPSRWKPASTTRATTSIPHPRPNSSTGPWACCKTIPTPSRACGSPAA
jgi:type III restriction enzyme